MESLRIIESVLGYSGDFFSALALEGGAHDSGRAWSSQGASCCRTHLEFSGTMHEAQRVSYRLSII